MDSYRSSPAIRVGRPGAEASVCIATGTFAGEGSVGLALFSGAIHLTLTATAEQARALAAALTEAVERVEARAEAVPA